MGDFPGDGHDWLTVHRVRLKAARDIKANPYPAPENAACWRFYPDSQLNETGERLPISDIWGGFAIHPSRVAAEAAFAAGDAALSHLGECVESWHALAVPVRHHGTTNWHGALVEDATFRAAAVDPGGPLLVITSAGFVTTGPDDMPRIAEFRRRVEEVRADCASRPENLRVAVFNGGMVDGGDGMTVSIWRDMPGMMTAAYKPGTHRGHLEAHKQKPQFDRSSFSRFRILASSGSWDGSNPVAGIG